MPFTLHPRLAGGCHPLGTRNHCHLLLKDNAVFPWLLVVPEVEDGIEDLHQLTPERHTEVCSVIRETSLFVTAHFQPTKLNVACIGNIVRQMHVHIVGRSENDPAWPGTVWASDSREPYSPDAITTIRSAARQALDLA